MEIIEQDFHDHNTVKNCKTITRHQAFM